MAVRPPPPEEAKTRSTAIYQISGLYIKVHEAERYGPSWAKTKFGIDLSKVDAGLPLPRMLDVDPKTLFRTIQAYRAHFGKGGSTPKA